MTEPHDAIDPWPELTPVTPLAPPPGSFERIAQAARRRQWASATATGALVLALLVGLAGLLALVGDPGQTPISPPTTVTTTKPEPSVTPTSPTPTTGACAADRLRVSVVTGDSAAGHIGLRIVFTNTSGQACTMDGYPGVVFVTSPTGSQVNRPAQPSYSGGGPTRGTLPPGHAAQADLLLVNTTNFPWAPCRPATVAGDRATAPQGTT